MQLTHDGGPHVLVGLLGDEVNGSLAGRVPQHGVPGGPGQRDVVDGVKRPEVGVEVTVVELSEGLHPMTLAVLTASRWSFALIRLASIPLTHVRGAQKGPHEMCGLQAMCPGNHAHKPYGRHVDSAGKTVYATAEEAAFSENCACRWFASEVTGRSMPT